MKYIINLIVAFLLYVGIGLSPYESEVDSGLVNSKEFYTEECTISIKNSVIWSAISGESVVTGPCDKLIDIFNK